MRMLRTMFTLAMLVVALLAIQAGTGAATAQAAVTCKHYDGWFHDGRQLSNQRVCAAPASDYPRYSGWGRIVERYSTSPSVCDFSLFPYDIDDPQPMLACVAMLPPPVQAWRWTGSRWVAYNGFQPGTQAYVAPYAAGWRWAWTAESGWVAIAERHVAFRWLA